MTHNNIRWNTKKLKIKEFLIVETTNFTEMLSNSEHNDKSIDFETFSSASKVTNYVKLILRMKFSIFSNNV